MISKILGSLLKQKQGTEKPADTATTISTDGQLPLGSLVINNGTHYQWPTGTRVKLSTNFYTTEFECPVGEYQQISVDLVSRLQRVRDEYNDSITVTSGNRTPEYQEQLAARGYKTAKNSQHVLGNAVDITARDMDKLLEICAKHFNAIGIARNFLHVDTRDDRPRRWSY